MTIPDELQFPADFLLGAATAAYQIEGGVREGGRGESIWDRFASRPGKVRNGDTGEVAADHFHRYHDDIRLMHELGIRSYRFSIAWPRVFPDGFGPINMRGLDFYDRLVDDLLEHDIEPFPTLYHWDLPQALQDDGGWINPAVVEAFGVYADAVVSALGDRVTNWSTLNEPWCSAWLGYGLGRHAPGIADVGQAIHAAHYLLLAHGRAAEVIRASAPRVKLGIVVNPYPIHPASGLAADRAAASERDAIDNRWFLDPLFYGRYPETQTGLEAYLPVDAEREIAAAAVPLDFLGVNYYTRHIVRAGNQAAGQVVLSEDVPCTAMGPEWEIYPDGLTEILVRLQRDYAPARMFVMENGAAFHDMVTPDRQVLDVQRTEYLHAHLTAARQAIELGVPLDGYFVWSLLDNFEWHDGYRYRFGIVYVDFQTQERLVKGSGSWYRNLIRGQRVPLLSR